MSEHSIRIGVDELFLAKERWWCHLLCDDFSEAGLASLHLFAQELQLPQRAFHDPPGQPRPHYDLTPPYRQRALQQGALALSRQNVVEFLKLGRQRRLTAQSQEPD